MATPRQKTNDAAFAVLSEKVDTIKSDVKDIKEKMESKYITVDQFQPVKMIVYGMVGLILTAIIVAIISGVLK